MSLDLFNKSKTSIFEVALVSLDDNYRLTRIGEKLDIKDDELVAIRGGLHSCINQTEDYPDVDVIIGNNMTTILKIARTSLNDDNILAELVDEAEIPYSELIEIKGKLNQYMNPPEDGMSIN